MTKPTPEPTIVTVCAAREDHPLLHEMEKHFALMENQGLIELLDDRELPFGKESDAQRVELVDQAAIVLLLISPSLMFKMNRNVMLQRALDRHVRGEILLIPIIVRPTDWKEYSFGKLVALPRDERAVTQWRDRDEAWTGIARSLRDAITARSRQPGAAKGGGPAMPPAGKGPGGGFSRGHALIIGTGDPGIEITEQDARAIHRLLVNPGRAGYPEPQARLLTGAEATRKRILDELDGLAARTNQDPDRDTTVMIYFSGHGLRGEGANPSYYLIPRGYQIGQEAGTAISGAEFSEKIAAIKSRKMIVFLDCCHAAGVPKAPGYHAAPLPAELEDQLGRGTGLVIVASSREDEKSWTGTPYSVFTTCLLEGLDGHGSSDEYARVLNVLGHLMQEVPKRQPNQHPIIKKMLDLGENFPLCYHGQVKGAAPAQQGHGAGAGTGKDAQGLSAGKRGRLERELNDLRGTESIYAAKLQRLRAALAREAGVSVQFQLEQEILDAERRIAEILAKVEEIEGQLGA